MENLALQLKTTLIAALKNADSMSENPCSLVDITSHFLNLNFYQKF